MIEKFNSEKHFESTKHFPFSYFSLALYLDFLAYVIERNGEQVVVAQDLYFPHDWPAMFLPVKKENWQNMSLTWATETDVKKVKAENIEIQVKNPIGIEFFYETASLLYPKGEVKRRIKQFNSLYEHKLLNEYDKDKIKEFYDKWASQKNRDGDTFDESERLFFFCLDNLEKYAIKQVYVEVGSKLVGLAWGVEHHQGGWAGLHLKVDYKYKGLSRFLHHERAKLFNDIETFTLGTGAHDKGIEQFKKELGPTEEREYFYISTLGKKE